MPPCTGDTHCTQRWAKTIRYFRKKCVVRLWEFVTLGAYDECRQEEKGKGGLSGERASHISESFNIKSLNQDHAGKHTWHTDKLSMLVFPRCPAPSPPSRGAAWPLDSLPSASCARHSSVQQIQGCIFVRTRPACCRRVGPASGHPVRQGRQCVLRSLSMISAYRPVQRPLSEIAEDEGDLKILAAAEARLLELEERHARLATARV